MHSFSNVYFYNNVVFSGVIRVFKTFIKYFSILSSGIVGCALLALIYTQPSAFASSHVINDPTPPATYNPMLTLALPGGATSGHPGTQIQLTGTGFPANSPITLYAATDQGQCADGQMGAASIQPTSGGSTTDGSGNFQLGASWPSSGATQPGTAYYVCAHVNDTNKASNITFTVLPNPTVTAGPQQVNPGDAVTVSGQNWNPQEALTVAITSGQGGPTIATQPATADGSGNFSISVTIPAGTQGGSYGINITDNSNATQPQYFSNAITVNQQATPTPQATPTATPTPTGSGNGSGSDNNGSMLWLIFGLGGLGVVLVIVGLTMFLTNSSNS